MTTKNDPICDKQPSWHQRLVRLRKFFISLAVAISQAGSVIGAGLFLGAVIAGVDEKTIEIVALWFALSFAVALVVGGLSWFFYAVEKAWRDSA